MEGHPWKVAPDVLWDGLLEKGQVLGRDPHVLWSGFPGPGSGARKTSPNWLEKRGTYPSARKPGGRARERTTGCRGQTPLPGPRAPVSLGSMTLSPLLLRGSPPPGDKVAAAGGQAHGKVRLSPSLTWTQSHRPPGALGAVSPPARQTTGQERAGGSSRGTGQPLQEAGRGHGASGAVGVTSAAVDHLRSAGKTVTCRQQIDEAIILQ